MVLIFFTFLYFGKEINNLDIDVRTHSLDLRDVFENLEKNQNKIAIEYKLNFNFIVLLENQVETCICEWVQMSVQKVQSDVLGARHLDTMQLYMYKPPVILWVRKGYDKET